MKNQYSKLGEKIKKERRNKLMELQQKISLENNEKYRDITHTSTLNIRVLVVDIFT